MHLVIVAGGLGSRLAPLTNYIPKFLVNIGKETGFVEQIRYWKGYAPDSITVIVHSAYKDLVQAYFNLYFEDNEDLQVPFIVKTVDEANGSAHAIFSTCEHLVDQPVLFTWCDVLPGEQFNVELLHQGGPVAFTNYDHPNRYDLVQTGKAWSQHELKEREDGRGGVFGMYYVSTYVAKDYEPGQDFADVLGKYSVDGYVQEVKIGSIIDFGDKPKLERTRATADGARSFNSVEVHGDLVLKKALNLQGESLIKREIAWYDELRRLNAGVSRPEYWPHRAEHSFVMSRVQGVPIWTLWPTLDDDGRRMVLTRIFEQLDTLHCASKKQVGNMVVHRDIRVEAYEKLINRYNEIRGVIDSFGPVVQVNDWVLREQDPLALIMYIYEELFKEYATVTEYSLIHGDLQMSNSMINPDTLEVTFIDPRGYFGKSDTYGLADYDIGKMYYSLSGYDLFNYSKDFHISSLKRGHLTFQIPRPNTSGCMSLIDDRFERRHQLWLAVCWIGLAQYIKNDPVKSVCAHYRGLEIADRISCNDFYFK
jgi:hypothetical protein